MFPILTSLVIFIFISQYFIHKAEKKNDKIMEDFWARENAANEVRKKPLDDLDYLHIPEEFFSFAYDSNDGKAAEAVRILNSLRDAKIVNLTGFSNTDLKLTYGTANITVLTAYDQNYTMLVRGLQMFAEYYRSVGDNDHAMQLLEYAVKTKTDVGASYRMLADIYAEKDMPYKISELIETASALSSGTSASVVRSLQEKLDKCGVPKL